MSTVDLLQCEVCQASYHPSCANMEVEVFCALQPILPAVGWVRPERVSMISDRRKSIDDQFENLNNAVQRLQKSQQKLIEKVEYLSAPVGSVSRSVGALSGSSGGLSTNLTRSDQSYCKKNVIISGLQESNDVSDADQVREICEEHFNYKPWFDAGLEIILQNYSVSLWLPNMLLLS